MFDSGRDPAVNLKRETELFERVDRGTLPEVLRFWVNSECLVRGRAKTAKYGWYDERLAAALNVPVIERSTGGGVVYQDEGNLNWSFFMRTSGAFVSPTTAFGRASEYVVKALRNLGVGAEFSPPNRIDVSGRKVSGMAARSTTRTLLVHGTLLLDSNLDKINRLCVPPPGCPAVANLSEWARGIDPRKIAEEIIAVLKKSGFQVRMENGWR